MFWLVIDPGWVLYAYAVDAVIAVPRTGSITRVLYPGWAQLFPCSLVFSASYPGRVLTSFVIPRGFRIWVSSPVFLLYCLRYLAVWFFLRHTLDGYWTLLLSLGGPVYGVSSPVFLLYCLRYLLLWVLVFWKLQLLPGQPAEAMPFMYGVVGGLRCR